MSIKKLYFEVGGREEPFLNLESTAFLGHTGLRHRLFLPKDDAAFFDFQKNVEHSFWMESVSIPIDIIFINSSLVVVGIHKSAIPFDNTPIQAPDTYRYVAEVNAGWCAYNAINTGCKIRFSEG
jgi:uncharacterized membrane protein (UPF0127 family)